MKLAYIDLLGDGERHEVAATVTTNHQASSYGQPVIVLDDGDALDITSWVMLNYQIIEATPDELEQLKRVLIIDPRLIAAAMGRVGGQSTSEAKKRASRANGKLGGRPKLEDKMSTENTIEVKLNREGFVDFLGSEERAEKYAAKLQSNIKNFYSDYEVSVDLYNINKTKFFIDPDDYDEGIKNHIENMMNELSNNLDEIL